MGGLYFPEQLRCSTQSLAEDVGALADADPQMMLDTEGRAWRQHDAALAGEAVRKLS